MSRYKLIDVYPYRISSFGHEFLLLKRSAQVEYGQQWRMIGGKVRNGEKAYEAAYRELKEETGVFPRNMWTLPKVNQFYSANDDEVYTIPAFAAELSNSTEIELNHEHSEYEWIAPKLITERTYWPEQESLWMLLDKILTEKSILLEWMIKLPGMS